MFFKKLLLLFYFEYISEVVLFHFHLSKKVVSVLQLIKEYF